jgi:hypothetical protein
MPLNLDSFLTAAKSLPKFLDVNCEELGGDVRVCQLSLAEAVDVSKFVTALSDDSGEVTDTAKMQASQVEYVAKSVADESGVRYLDSEQGRQVLAALPPGTLSRLFNAAQRLSGMQPRVEESKKS